MPANATGIDAGTGATKDLKPNPLVVKLSPVVATTVETPVSTAIPAKPAEEVPAQETTAPATDTSKAE